MKSKHLVSFRLTAEQHSGLLEQAAAENLTVSDYIKQRLFPETRDRRGGDPAIRNQLAEIREAVGNAEDIYRQLNQDSVRILRRLHIMTRMERYMISNFFHLPEQEVDQLLKEYLDKSIAAVPDRPDTYMEETKRKQEEESRQAREIAEEEAKRVKENETFRKADLLLAQREKRKGGGHGE